MEKNYIIIIATILLLPVVSAMTCEVDTEPYIEFPLMINCESIQRNDTFCYVSISLYDEAQPIIVLPRHEYIDGVGMIDYYRFKEGKSVIRLVTNRLVSESNYTLTVYCANLYGDYEKWQTTIKPKSSRTNLISYILVVLKNDVVLIILALIILIFAIYLFKKT